MATFLSSSFSIPPPPPAPPPVSSSLCRRNLPFFSVKLPSFPLRATSYPIAINPNPRKFLPVTLASTNSDSYFDEFSSNSNSRSTDKKSVLSDLIRDIEPLDISLIQKDVPPTTVDAMKRTISGMLGLLPSDRFKVFIEALWEPLSKLLVSSMMTGYTLQNAEYRLCLEKNLDLHEGHVETEAPTGSKVGTGDLVLENVKTDQFTSKGNEAETIHEDLSDKIDIQALGELSPEARQYIHHLHFRLSSVRKELHEVKRRSSALQMQQFVGEEKNDLLDYLRSLEPEKVAELSEPTSPELKETIHTVVHGLLATLSPRMHSTAPHSGNTASGMINIGGEDCTELVENTSLHFQPLISLTRDYLARLLFWCMLLGHFLRGLEYRMELTELLSLTSTGQLSSECETGNEGHGNEHVA